MSTPQPGRQTAYTRAILFGIGAAVAGMILYAGVEILTGWVIGYAAVAVGYLVGKAMKKGSAGRGGRRYQVAAALLTYAAVSLAAIPVGIHAYRKQHATETSTASPPRGATDLAPTVRDQKEPDSGERTNSVLSLLALGLASPFLDLSEGAGGLIGLFILFIGIRAAWGLTAGSEVAVAGPYRASDSPDASFSKP